MARYALTASTKKHSMNLLSLFKLKIKKIFVCLLVVLVTLKNTNSKILKNCKTVKKKYIIKDEKFHKNWVIASKFNKG